jgi:predicted ATP-grasp superfamily ATP-dependent carboligase
MPAGVEFFRDDATIELIRKLMAALDWNGVANIDLRFDNANGRALILEVNPRFWGSLFGSLSVGVNFAELACRLALGLELPDPGYRPGRFIVEKRAAVRHLFRKRGPEAAPLRSVLWHVARDPLPEIALQLQPLLKRPFKLRA